MQQSMTTFSISFVFKGLESRSCYGINFPSQSAIDFKKKKQQPKFSNMEFHQPYFSFISSVPFWTNKGFYIFTWQTSVFVRTPVSKSNTKEVPWNQQKYS